MEERGIEYEFRPAFEPGKYRVTLHLSNGDVLQMNDLHSDWWLLNLIRATADGSAGSINCAGGDVILTRHIARIHYEKVEDDHG